MAFLGAMALRLLLLLAAGPRAATVYGPPPCSGDERPFSGVGFNASACGLHPCSNFEDCPAPPSGVTARPTCTSSYCVLACGALVGGNCSSAATCFDLGGVGVGVCLFPDAATDGLLLAPGPPPPAPGIDCTPWGCRCDGFADYFGAIAGQCGGCAGGAGTWWGKHHCNTIAMSGTCCDGPACTLPNASGCQKSARPPVATDVPSYPPTYNMSRSTIAMPCDYKGYVSELPGWAATTSKFNVLDIDWSNNKAVWANTPGADGKGMSCEEDLVRQATKIKQDDPAHHTWVYRNIVNAYPWMTSVRRILDDPAYDVWFLRFKNGTDGKGPLEHADDGTYNNPVCDHAFTPPKCSPLFHSQTQTPQYAPNGTTKKCGTGPAKKCTWQPDFGDGMCTKPCDCGRVPCGFCEYMQRSTPVAAVCVPQPHMCLSSRLGARVCLRTQATLATLIWCVCGRPVRSSPEEHEGLLLLGWLPHTA